jgi:hypothetical protein
VLAASAKLWFQEEDFPFANPTRDLDVMPWRRAVHGGKDKAVWGLCAPEGDGFEIKGALINQLGQEIVPASKVLRHHEIPKYGFS